MNKKREKKKKRSEGSRFSIYFGISNFGFWMLNEHITAIWSDILSVRIQEPMALGGTKVDGGVLSQIWSSKVHDPLSFRVGRVI